MEKQTIILIDDETVEKEILASYLTAGGYNIIQAGNGAEGLELLRKYKIDLVLLDVQMPVMNGFQTITEMKKDSVLSEIPVIFLTSLDKTNLHIRGLESGAVHYLTKPYNKAVLLATVKSVLRQSTSDLKMDLPDTILASDADMTGSMNDFPLTELLQSLEMGRKTAKIDFPELNAVIFIDNGLLTLIKQDDYFGEDAFLRMLIFERGHFNVYFGEKTDENIHDSLPVFHTIMESTRVFDELQQKLNKLPGFEEQISINNELLTSEDAQLLEIEFPNSFETLLRRINGSIAENIDYCLDLMEYKKCIRID